MIAVADSSVLLHLFEPSIPAPEDPGTGKPVDRCKERVDFLLTTLAKRRCKLIIPAPTLAEVLSKAGTAGPEWLRLLSNSAAVGIVPFDTRAAIECAALTAERIANNRGAKPRWKAKFDEQIVSIAHVVGASAIYSDDSDIVRLARSGVEVVGVAALPLPPDIAQQSFLDDGP